MVRIFPSFLMTVFLVCILTPLSLAQTSEREYRFPKLHGLSVDRCINSSRFPSSERCSTRATQLVADMFCKELGHRNATDWFPGSSFPRKMWILRETVGDDGTTLVFEPKTAMSQFAIITCSARGFVQGNHPTEGQDFSTVRVDGRFLDKCVRMARFGDSQRCSYSAQFEAATAFCRTKGWFRAQHWKLGWHLPTSHKLYRTFVSRDGRVSQSFGNITGTDYFKFIRCKWRTENP